MNKPKTTPRNKIKIVSSQPSQQSTAILLSSGNEKRVGVTAKVSFEYRGLFFFLREDKTLTPSEKKEKYHIIELTSGRSVFSSDIDNISLIERPFRDFIDRHWEVLNKHLATYSYSRLLINNFIYY